MIQECKRPVILAANKVDKLPDKTMLLPLMERFSRILDLAAIVPMSASKGKQVPAVIAEIEKLLPESAPLFPKEQFTDLSERFLCAEMIREQVYQCCEKEIPYETAIEIEDFNEAEREVPKHLIVIKAVIHVSRESHRPIILGRSGDRIKEIGTFARRAMEKMLGAKVHLELFVHVEPEWTRSDNGLAKVGYGPVR